MQKVALLAAAAAAAGFVMAGSAQATPAVTVTDSYLGGQNTYTGADVIGPTSVFDIKSAVFQRLGPDGNTLRVTINTNYAGVPGTSAASHTGYGVLFLTPGGAWSPTGPAPYANDVYQPGDWTYAFTIPQEPVAASGLGGLYKVADGTVVMSNVLGNPITYPHPGNPGYYFREGQAVQFTPDVGATALAGGTWSVGPGALTFDIVDNHLLGNDLAFSWAMTCGNDVIQGVAGMVPEPSTWAMMLIGFGGLGASLRRRRALAGLA